MGFDRVMGWAGEDADAPTRASKIRAFQTVLLFHLWLGPLATVAGSWNEWTGAVRFQLGTAAALSLIGLLLPAARRGVFAAFAVLTLAQIALTFPLGANHGLAEFVTAGLLAFLDLEKDEEQILLLALLRWLFAIVFFYAGVQKLIHGCYFRGEALAYFIAGKPSYASFFSMILPSEDLARLGALAASGGVGPYRVSLPLFILLSNLSYILEIVLPFLLMARRTRSAAVLATAAFVVMIGSSSFEFLFNIFYLNLLLLFCRSDLNRKLQGAFIATLAALAVLHHAFGGEIWFN